MHIDELTEKNDASWALFIRNLNFLEVQHKKRSHFKDRQNVQKVNIDELQILSSVISTILKQYHYRDFQICKLYIKIKRSPLNLIRQDTAGVEHFG